MEEHVPAALAGLLRGYGKAAVALSGGVDSSYLLYAARACGCDARAYYVRTAFQPAFEEADARRLAQGLGVELQVLPYDILAAGTVAQNPPDRCYHCKKRILGLVCAQARQAGYRVVLDGTNASDDAGGRPGMAALGELAVASPLRAAGVGKAAVRELARAAGLFNWDKPAYACLATRIPAGEPITAEKLARVEAAEDALRALGFTDLRVRLFNGAARIQVPEAEVVRAAECRAAIRQALCGLFPAVLLDLEGR